MHLQNYGRRINTIIPIGCSNRLEFLFSFILWADGKMTKRQMVAQEESGKMEQIDTRESRGNNGKGTFCCNGES